MSHLAGCVQEGFFFPLRLETADDDAENSTKGNETKERLHRISSMKLSRIQTFNYKSSIYF